MPIVLNRDEVVKLFSSVSNLKHKAILMLIYSAGLRVNETVKLKQKNIDFQRKLIHIEGKEG